MKRILIDPEANKEKANIQENKFQQINITDGRVHNRHLYCIAK